jgi:hypothetical protein
MENRSIHEVDHGTHKGNETNAGKPHPKEGDERVEGLDKSHC